MKRKPSEVIADCKLLKTNSFVTECLGEIWNTHISFGYTQIKRKRAK